MPEETLTERIKNRDSWLRVGIISAATLLLVWKLAHADFGLAAFDFSALLSLLLALFAVALSVAFYFKATDTSNAFYDNTYKFTKEVSEILGRIEAGFGERLRHLDEGYSGLRDSFARLPFDSKAANQALKEEEEVAQKVERERQELLLRVADRAKLQEQERKEFFAKLASTDQELRQARVEIASLKRQLEEAGEGNVSARRSSKSGLLERVTHYISHPDRRAILRPENGPMTLDGLRAHFSATLERWPPPFLADLRRLNYLDDSNQLTERGVRWVRSVLLHGEHGA